MVTAAVADIHIGKVEKQQTQSLELNQFHFMSYTRKLSRILCTYFPTSELMEISYFLYEIQPKQQTLAICGGIT